MATASTIGGVVKIIHGANDDVFAAAGQRVQAVRRSIVDAFNIPDDALTFVNGEQVDGSYTLQPNDTLEFCKQSGNKGIRRLFTKAEIRREYTGYPADVLDDFFVTVRHDDVNRDGQAMWHEAVVDEWLDDRYSRKQADDGRDKVIPPHSVRLDCQQYDDLTPNEWRLLEVIINKPGVKIDEVAEHVYGHADERENSLTQAIKRLNRRLLEKRCPFVVSQANGFISIKK